MRNSSSWTCKDKEITELSRKDDFLDEDDEHDYEFEALYADSVQPKHKPRRVRPRNESFVEHSGSCEADLISEIDRKIKEHVDNVLYEMNGLSSRVTQLEGRMSQMENAVDNLKVAIEYNHGKTDGKLGELNNILREVQGGIKDLADKQEIAEAQLQLAKLQLSKGEQQLGKQNSTSQTDSTHGALPSVPQESHQLLLKPIGSPQQPAVLPSNISQNPHHPNPLPTPTATAPQLPSLVPQNTAPSYLRNEPYSSSSVQITETTHRQYHMPSIQQSQLPPPAMYQPDQPKLTEATHQHCHITSTRQSQLLPQAQQQPYQPAPQLPSVSQLDQPWKLHPSFSTVYYQEIHPSSQHPGEVPNLPSQGIQQSSVPSAGLLPTQPSYVGSTQQMHDQTPSRPYREFISGYSPPLMYSNSQNLSPYGASPFGSSSTNMKLLRPLPSPSVPSGGSSYSQVPTTKTLPHAIPMASSVDSESASGGAANRVPIEDVVDKVVAMGFRRDLVRATVRKLTENGQSVDLNVVLDKLMKNG